MTVVLSPELTLVAACCRWPPSPAREAAVRSAAEGVRWELFEQVVTRHRVGVLVHDGLSRARIDVPPRIAIQLKAKAERALRIGQAVAGEMVQLQRALEGAGVATLFIKGETLGILAYGAVGMKHSADVDMLIDLQQLLAARQVLSELGYSLNNPASLSDPKLLRYAEFAKEATFVSRARGLAVDLHWRLVDNPRLLSGVDVFSPGQTVHIGGQALRTLNDRDLFAYLCVHGARHSWSRLKWLADLNALIASRGPDEIQDLYRAAEQIGAARPAALALLICHRVLGLALTGTMIDTLQEDPAVVRLAANALFCLGHPVSGTDSPLYSPPGFRIMVANYFLQRGAVYMASELRLAWTCARDRTFVPLPRSLEYLYHALRIPLWLGRVGHRLLKRLVARSGTRRGVRAGIAGE